MRMTIVAKAAGFDIPVWVRPAVLESILLTDKNAYVTDQEIIERIGYPPSTDWFNYTNYPIASEFIAANLGISRDDTGAILYGIDNGRHRTRWLITEANNSNRELIPICIPESQHKFAIEYGLMDSVITPPDAANFMDDLMNSDFYNGVVTKNDILEYGKQSLRPLVI